MRASAQPVGGERARARVVRLEHGGCANAVGAAIATTLSRRIKSICLSLIATTCAMFLYAYGPHHSVGAYYGLCLILGIGIGYWAMFVQMGAEQFGTNIRATAATSIPNMVRGSVIFSTMAFQALKPILGITDAGLAVVGSLLVLAFISLFTLKETFGEDLDYVER
mgnify:CR=1 FL=1